MVQATPHSIVQKEEEAAFSIIAIMRSLFIVILLSLVPPTVTGGSIYDDRPYNTLQFTPNVTHRHDLCDRQVCVLVYEHDIRACTFLLLSKLQSQVLMLNSCSTLYI